MSFGNLTRSICLLLLATLLLCFLSACGGGGPEEAVKALCEGVKTWNAEKLTQSVTSALDVLVYTSIAQSAESETAVKELKNAAKKISYSIDTPVIDGDSATVDVHFKYTDLSEAAKEYESKAYEEMLSASLSAKNETEAIKKANEIASRLMKDAVKKGVPAEVTLTFECTKTDSGWKVSKLPDGLLEIMLSNWPGSDMLSSLGNYLQNQK